MSRRRVSFSAVLAGLAVAVAAMIWTAPAEANRMVAIEAPSRFAEFNDENAPLYVGLGGFSQSRPQTLMANVLLPDGFRRDHKRGYPVLYLLHGATSDYRMWERLERVSELAKDFPGIIVMPDGGAFGMYTDWYNGGDFGAPRWLSYHLTDLRRTVAKRFPIRPGRRWHAIGGLSMGGMGALRYAAADPGYFGSVASFSGAALDLQAIETVLVFDGAVSAVSGARFEEVWGPPNGFYATANNPQRLIPNLRHTRVFVTAGSGLPCAGDFPITDVILELGLRRQADAWVAAARKDRVDVIQERTCGGHSVETATRSLRAALRWGFFEPVPRRPGNWTYVTAARSGRAHDLRFRFRAQPQTVIRFERAGDTLRGTGAGAARIRAGRRCAIDVRLPFEISLPRRCGPAGRPPTG